MRDGTCGVRFSKDTTRGAAKTGSNAMHTPNREMRMDVNFIIIYMKSFLSRECVARA